MSTDDTMRQKIKEKNSELKSVPPEYFNLGFYLVTPLLLGVVGGFFLDRRFGHQHTFIIVGLTLGTIATFYNLFKLVKDSDKKN